MEVGVDGQTVAGGPRVGFFGLSPRRTLPEEVETPGGSVPLVVQPQVESTPEGRELEARGAEVTSPPSPPGGRGSRGRSLPGGETSGQTSRRTDLLESSPLGVGRCPEGQGVAVSELIGLAGAPSPLAPVSPARTAPGAPRRRPPGPQRLRVPEVGRGRGPRPHGPGAEGPGRLPYRWGGARHRDETTTVLLTLSPRDPGASDPAVGPEWRRTGPTRHRETRNQRSRPFAPIVVGSTPSPSKILKCHLSEYV